MWETIKNDPILRIVTIIILSVLGFGLAFNIVFSANNGTDVLILLLKILLFVSVVGLVFGIIMFIRHRYSKEIAMVFTSIRSEKDTAVEYEACASCGKKLKPEWKCCPNCGREKGAGTE